VDAIARSVRTKPLASSATAAALQPLRSRIGAQDRAIAIHSRCRWNRASTACSRWATSARIVKRVGAAIGEARAVVAQLHTVLARRQRPSGSNVQSAELVLALLIAGPALVTLARRLGTAYPSFSSSAVSCWAWCRACRGIRIGRILIFLLVLPPLLYVAAFFTPLRRLHANLGTIGSSRSARHRDGVGGRRRRPRADSGSAVGRSRSRSGRSVAPPDEIAPRDRRAGLASPRRIVTILEARAC